MRVKVTKKAGPFYTFLNEGQGHQKRGPFNTFLFKHELQCQFRIIYNYRST
jgi:hypothetical protein